MKVAIVYFNFGGGHKEASVNVANALREQAPDVEVELFDGLSLSPGPIGRFWTWVWNYVQSDNQAAWNIMYNWSFFSTKFWGYWMNWWMWWDLRKALADFRPDHVLTAHFIGPPMAEKLRRKEGLDYTISHFLTEFVWHSGFDWHPFLDRYFICSEEVKQRILDNGFPEERVCMTGIPIKPVFSERMDKATAREKLDITTDKKVLFFFAGTFGGTKLERVLRETKTREVFPVVVCGKNEATQARVEKLFEEEGIDGIVYGFVDFMHTIMCACDLMVGKGGALSVSECLALGVPIVLYGSPPGNETGNAEFMQRIGGGVIADDIDAVLKNIDELLESPDRLRAMSESAAAHGFPHAARDAAAAVIAMDREARGEPVPERESETQPA